MPGAYKIGAAISSPRIARGQKNYGDKAFSEIHIAKVQNRGSCALWSFLGFQQSAHPPKTPRAEEGSFLVSPYLQNLGDADSPPKLKVVNALPS